MTIVIGRETDLDAGPTCRLGAYRALDGSESVPLWLDLDGPHAVSIVGKRGYGKSYTMGVIAEGLSRSRGVAPVIVDAMGAFGGLADPSSRGDTDADPSSRGDTDAEQVPATVIDSPTVRADAIDPQSWCRMLGLDPAGGPGTVVWAAAASAGTLSEMRAHVASADATRVDRRAATNHLELAASWGIFDPGGLDAPTLATGDVTVLDVAGLDEAPRAALVRAVAGSLYRGRVGDRIDRLPWLLVDEAHAYVDTVAQGALDTLLTRGRAPGVSLVLATQRPGVLPDVAVSQSDLLVAHRLTATPDLAALERVQPTYADRAIEERLPTDPGEVLIVDDETECVHAATVRERDTPHFGDSPSASETVRRGSIR